MPRVDVTEDIANEFDWSSVTRTYADDTDELLQELYVFDDGTTQQLDYENGILRSDFRTDPVDNGLGEIYPWQELTLIYDADGGLVQRNIFMDDNRYITNEFVDGYLQEKQLFNQDGLNGLDSDYSWLTRTIVYDQSGEVTYTETANLDGTSVENTFVDGVLRDKVLYDPNDGDALTEFTSYDETGEMVSKDSDYADGAYIERVYSDGALRSVSEEEIVSGGKDIDFRFTVYDAEGDVASSLTEYLGGEIIALQYTDGVLTTARYDTATGEDGQYFNWHSGTKSYDEAGQLTHSDLFYDSGVSEEKSFENGVLRSKVRVDDTALLNLEALSWDTIEFNYDAAGALELKSQTFDDGDVTVTLFDAGQKQSKLVYDGDNDMAWLAREVQFDASGNIDAVTTYDNAEDIPDQYGLDAMLML